MSFLVCLIMTIGPTDELPHDGARVEEWLFAAWSPDGSVGVVSGHRLLGRTAWYWAALVERGRPLMHLTEWDVTVRPDRFVVKAPELWAEHHCDDALRQWSIGNEAYAVAIDDADDALGLGYGSPTPTAFDLEWYAVEGVRDITDGYEQVGVVHGDVEVLGRRTVTLVEVPARRWHRWTGLDVLAPVALDRAVAHTGLRAPFAFPDGSVADWVLTPAGWKERGVAHSTGS
jgi:hypothetical protein